jgi:hypothetical protein
MQLEKDLFLGLLYPVEEHKIFGYVTNTDIKILLVVKDMLLREDKMRDLRQAAGDALPRGHAAAEEEGEGPNQHGQADHHTCGRNGGTV